MAARWTLMIGVSLPRCTLSVAFVPDSPVIRLRISLAVFPSRDTPSDWMMISPALRPASSAGEPEMIRVTKAPLSMAINITPMPSSLPLRESLNSSASSSLIQVVA